jgi:hypothetical protein
MADEAYQRAFQRGISLAVGETIPSVVLDLTEANKREFQAKGMLEAEHELVEAGRWYGSQYMQKKALDQIRVHRSSGSTPHVRPAASKETLRSGLPVDELRHPTGSDRRFAMGSITNGDIYIPGQRPGAGF